MLSLMIVFSAIVVIVLCYQNVDNQLSFVDNELSNERKSKFFGWGFGVGIVRFENKYCQTNEGLDGTCYTRRQCRELEGTASGACAGTIGRCCTIQQGCGTISSHNNTYFVNNNFPSLVTGSTSCNYVIRKCSPEICQVRIDFLSLTLASPDANGFCIYDSIRITGGASVIRPFCGDNSGQHIYLGFDGDNDIIISIITSALRELARSWYIKVAQIGCDCSTRAPDGCLMYYTETTGTVTSFNYGRTQSGESYYFDNADPMRLPGTREIANLNYGVCIQMMPGYCSIEWTPTTNISFGVSGSTPNPTNMNENDVLGCLRDYVLIPNPTPPNTITPDRFCGNFFPPLVTSSSKPFVLYVVTDNTESYSNTTASENDIGNIGFSLNYRQIPCNPLQQL